MPMMMVDPAGPGIASPRSLEGNLVTLRGDVKKGHAIKGLSLFGNAVSLYNFCKESLDNTSLVSIFSLA